MKTEKVEKILKGSFLFLAIIFFAFLFKEELDYIVASPLFGWKAMLVSVISLAIIIEVAYSIIHELKFPRPPNSKMRILFFLFFGSIFFFFSIFSSPFPICGVVIKTTKIFYFFFFIFVLKIFVNFFWRFRRKIGKKLATFFLLVFSVSLSILLLIYCIKWMGINYDIQNFSFKEKYFDGIIKADIIRETLSYEVVPEPNGIWREKDKTSSSMNIKEGVRVSWKPPVEPAVQMIFIGGSTTFGW